MLFNILPVLLMFLSLGVIVLIVGRRLPEIASLKIEDIEAAQISTKKRQFLFTKLEERIRVLMSQSWESTGVARTQIKEGLNNIYSLIAQIERRGRFASSTTQPKAIAEILNAAKVESENQKWSEAEQLYLDVLRYDERNQEAYAGLGLVYKALEQYEGAKESLMFAVRLNTQDINSWIALAEVQVESVDLQGAIESYKRAIELAPEIIEYKVALGDLLMSQGESETALEVFLSVVDREPANPRALDRLLEAAIICKKKRIAQSALRNLKKNNPENNKIADFEERIQNIG
jgi:tetratricopeptide (TPR) repeat protein